MNWTQPICDMCWIDQEGARQPSRLIDAETERCAWCGKRTVSGIYKRADPRTLPYPSD